MRRRGPLDRMADRRGRMDVLLRGEWREVNYVETIAGSTRHGHYHKLTKEAIYLLSGCVEVTIGRADETVSTFTLPIGELLIVEPGEIHTLEVIQKAAWIQVMDRPYKQGSTDTYLVGQECCLFCGRRTRRYRGCCDKCAERKRHSEVHVEKCGEGE